MCKPQIQQQYPEPIKKLSKIVIKIKLNDMPKPSVDLSPGQSRGDKHFMYTRTGLLSVAIRETQIKGTMTLYKYQEGYSK